ncbi:MAG: NAD-dependent epimerase/dehydratase family protein [Pseudorhodoplanes sp.]
MLTFVTGARGAIGRHVVAEARSRGHRVAGVGHGSWTGDAELPAIDHWINGGIDGDNLSALARVVGEPNMIVHLAGGSLVGDSIQHPGEDFRRSVLSAQQLLEWLRTNAPTARLVIASSAAVYGNGHDGPILETAPFAPVSPYGTHKAIVEMMAAAYARQYGLSVAIIRLFSVYGPGLRKQLIWELTCRLLHGERAITLGGTGQEQRDFVYVRDGAVMLLDAAALADTTSPVFNGSSGRAISIRELVEMVAFRFAGARFGFTGEIRPGDPTILVGNEKRARAAGLNVTTPLEAGLARTLEWIEAGRAPDRER